jgi:pimeloyl-ACP methyl ester carboxylesterase
MRRLDVIVAVILLVILALGTWLYTPDLKREALEQKYHVQPGDYLTVAGIRLHVLDSGPRTAPALILLHGFGGSLQTWDGWAGPLSKTMRVIRYDLPGFGLTGPDPTGDYSDARAATILGALMDKLGLEKASLAGNSMGGRLAWEFAAQYPSRVEKLILISPDGFASPGFEYGRAPAVPLMLRALPYTLPASMLRMSIAPAYADPAHLTQQTLMRYRDMMLAPGVRRAIIARTAQTILRDPEPLLRTIQAPTLLLWGEDDHMIPISNAADYMKDIPHCTLVRLPGLGHVPFEEAPERSLVPVERFLAG